jgi:electron transfer flavoprotein alpha subunit
LSIAPDLYVAFGVSGATQHTAGLGTPRHVVSVNTDPSSPMTALADLGLITDAPSMLLRLAERLGVPVPAGLAPVAERGHSKEPARMLAGKPAGPGRSAGPGASGG